MPRRCVQELDGLGRKVNKNKGCERTEQGRGLARSVHYTKTWTHSDRRLSQVRERGGRGLLKDECWSFPPASEREARMDDPTRRSKKGRQWNASLGGSCSQARAPVLISPCFYFYAAS